MENLLNTIEMYLPEILGKVKVFARRYDHEIKKSKAHALVIGVATGFAIVSLFF